MMQPGKRCPPAWMSSSTHELAADDHDLVAVVRDNWRDHGAPVGLERQ